MGADTRISVTDLRAGYGGLPVLHDLSFSVDAGCVLTVAGPNGAGKSTLLRTLAGLVRPSGGMVKVDGRDLFTLSGRERARKIAVLFTERVKKEPETCFDVAAQGRYPYIGFLGGLSEKDRTVVREAMAETDCLDLKERYFGELSDGQKQRVLLARAIAQQPEILLLDEPATFLDLRYQLELMELLRRLASDKKRRLTVVMSLHDVRLAERFSDTLLMLKDGRKYAEGRPQEIVSPRRLAELYQISAGLMESFWGKDGAGPEKAPKEDPAEAPKADPAEAPKEDPAEAPKADSAETQKADSAEAQKAGSAADTGADSSEGQGTDTPPDPGDPASAPGLRDLQEINASARKGMKKGFTTGTAAALAAQGAAILLLSGICSDELSVLTPAGIRVSVRHEGCRTLSDGEAECTVRKMAGDDADVTDGIRITAHVRLTQKPGILIDGGEGIGRVTKPGLDQPVGAAAINRVPRKMIRDVLREAAKREYYTGGFSVIIEAQDGQKRAENTMNGMLGITGGISILGTGGIVEPMSRQALVDTIRVDIRQKAALGHDRLILVPGKYGTDFVKSAGLTSSGVPVAIMSNFVGEALDIAGEEGFSQVLLAGHVGKLVKLEASIMNTHSGCADGRREIFVACAAMAGAPYPCLEKLWDCATTDACISVLEEYSILRETKERILCQIQRNLDKRTGGKMQAGALLFYGKGRMFGVTETGGRLLSKFGCRVPDTD